MNQRIRQLTVGLIVLFGILFVQLTNWQVVQRDSLVNNPRNNRVTIREFDTPRGDIVTADGTVIAATVPTDAATSSSRFKFQRTYPTGQLFANVTGYYTLGFGSTQLERTQSDVLTGKTAQQQLEATGGLFSKQDNAGSVHVTLRNDLQKAAKKALGNREGSVVVTDPRTGAVLAMYSNPSFDPNLFVRGISQADYSLLTEHDHRPLANKTVQGAYPPGSTFKMVTALAALEAGVIDLDTKVRCPGYLESGSRKFHCWKKGGHGTVGLARSLAESCDVFYYEVAQKVGIDAIAEMGKRMGLGTRHELPMSAITEGIMPDKDWKQERWGQDWRIGDTINASIGQGYVLASPLQLAVMTARVATGRAIEPRLIKSVGAYTAPQLSQLSPYWSLAPHFGHSPLMKRSGKNMFFSGSKNCSMVLRSISVPPWSAERSRKSR